jgi:hypothetical protein
MYLKVGYMSHRRKKEYGRNGGKVSLRRQKTDGCCMAHLKWEL